MTARRATLRAPLPVGTLAAVGRIRRVEYLVLAFDQRPDTPWPAELTPAERSVAALLVRGLANLEIARARDRSLRTVANQVASVFRKLGVGSRMELLARASIAAPVPPAIVRGRSRRSARGRPAT